MNSQYTNENLDTFCKRRRRYLERGQATAEFVLLLVATVAIIGIASARLFTPVKKWANFYLSDYTYCLIDTGQLPKEAGGNPTDCDQLASDSGFGAAGAAADAQKNSDQMQADAAAKAKTQAAMAAQRAQNARKVRSQQRRGGGSQASNSSVSFDTPKAADSSPEGEGKSSKVRHVGRYEKNSRLGRAMGNESGEYQSRSRAIGLSGELIDEQEKIMRREGSSMQISSASAEERAMKPRKLKMEPPKRKDASVSSDDGASLSFGGMMRMALICGVLLVVLYLVGTQVNSVMKGMD